MKIKVPQVYDHHIPDATVRIHLPQQKVKFGTLIPDGCAELATRHYVVFEYENASRGLLTGVVKYQHFCSQHPDIVITVIFIEILWHQTAHKQDTKLAKFTAEHLVPNVTFVFQACNGTIANVDKIVRKAINS